MSEAIETTYTRGRHTIPVRICFNVYCDEVEFDSVDRENYAPGSVQWKHVPPESLIYLWAMKWLDNHEAEILTHPRAPNGER